jgi:hypothetical protein
VARTTLSPGQVGMPGISGTEISIGILVSATDIAPFRHRSEIVNATIKTATGQVDRRPCPEIRFVYSRA